MAVKFARIAAYVLGLSANLVVLDDLIGIFRYGELLIYETNKAVLLGEIGLAISICLYSLGMIIYEIRDV